MVLCCSVWGAVNSNLTFKFEFTAPHTLQHNGIVERKFATLYGRIRSMFYGCGMTEGLEIRKGLWCECANTATKHENIVVRDINPPFTKFHGFDSKIVPYLRQFGEMGVVAVRKKIQGKMESKGTVCMFVGYAEDHSGDTYRMLNIATKKIILSRDVRWLNKMYVKWARQNESSLDPNDIIPDVVVSGDVEEVNEDQEEKQMEEVKQAQTTTVIEPKPDNRRLICEMARLGGTTFNVEADRIRNKASENKEKEQEDKMNAIFEEMKLEYDLALVMNEILLSNKEEKDDDEKIKLFMIPEDVSDSVLINALDYALNDEKWRIGEEFKREELLKNAVMQL